MYSCHLFLISSASVRSIPFLPLIVPIFAWSVPLVSLIFLKRSLVFPIVLFPSISLHWSLRKTFLSLLAILWNSAFKWVYLSFHPLPLASPLFTAICKASSDNAFTFLHFFGKVMITTSCIMSRTYIHSSSGTLSDLIPWIYLSLLLCNCKGFDLSHTQISQFSSTAQSCPTLCDPMNRSAPGLPVHHQLPESTQTHVHRVGDAIQPSHPLSSPSPPALNLSQHQSLFKWVSSPHEMAKLLEFQLQHQSFQWIFRTDFL